MNRNWGISRDGGIWRDFKPKVVFGFGGIKRWKSFLLPLIYGKNCGKLSQSLKSVSTGKVGLPIQFEFCAWFG